MTAPGSILVHLRAGHTLVFIQFYSFIQFIFWTYDTVSSYIRHFYESHVVSVIWGEIVAGADELVFKCEKGNCIEQVGMLGHVGYYNFVVVI